jgi:hypothetical protein
MFDGADLGAAVEQGVHGGSERRVDERIVAKIAAQRETRLQ